MDMVVQNEHVLLVPKADFSEHSNTGVDAGDDSGL